VAEAYVDPAFHQGGPQTEAFAWREQAWVDPDSVEEAWEAEGLDEREEAVVQEVRQEDPEVPAWREQAWVDPAFGEEAAFQDVHLADQVDLAAFQDVHLADRVDQAAFQDVHLADRVDLAAWADLPFEEAHPFEADHPDAVAYLPEDPE